MRTTGSVPKLQLTGPGEPGLVSVVIPTYNRAYNLSASIESVLQQTYRNTEILIVDDGSTDETAKVVAEYGPQVRYLFQRNAGPAAARNCGFRHARGEFVALNDSDDRWWPWKLEAQVNALCRYPDIGMVWTDCSAVTDMGERLDRAWLRNRYSAWRSLQIDRVCERRAALEELCTSAPPHLAKAPLYVGDLFSQMILGNLVITSSIVLRRDRLRASGGFDESLARSGEDYEFHLRTCWHGPVAFLDAPSMDVRTGFHDQLTSPEMHMYLAKNSLVTVTRWLDRGQDRVCLSDGVVRRRLSSLFGWLGEEEIRSGDRKEARRHLSRSLCLNPRQPHRLLLLGFAVLPPVALRSARSARAMMRRRRSRELIDALAD